MKVFFAFLAIVVLFASLLIIFYLTALFGKIADPHYKNLRYEEFGWLGLILPFAFLEFLALRYFFRKLKKKIVSGPQGWR